MTPRPLTTAEALALPILGALSLLLAWQWLVPALGVPAYIVPTPLAILRTLAAEWRFLLTNAVPTWIEALLGFFLGNALAVLLAIGFVYAPRFRAAYFPVVLLFNTIPVLALAPIIILIFGLGMLPKVIIAALICFFPTLVNMTRGLRDVGPEQLELMHVLSASPREVFFKLRVQNSLPYLFSALKIAASTAVIGAIVGEWIGSTLGIGALIIQSTYNFDSPLLYATIVVGSTFSALFFGVISLVERRVLRWNVPHNA